MYLIFDIETTGLVKCEKFNLYPNFTENDKYDSSRIVQIAWAVLDINYKIVDKKSYIIKKDNFDIPNAAFHGITNEISLVEGTNFNIVMMDFCEALMQCNYIVAHNILFDYNVLLHHLYRYNLNYIFCQFKEKNQFCTSFESTNILQLPMPYASGHYKYPSLQELYSFYFKKKIPNAHTASADVKACAECFILLVQDNRYKYK